VKRAHGVLPALDFDFGNLTVPAEDGDVLEKVLNIDFSELEENGLLWELRALFVSIINFETEEPLSMYGHTYMRVVASKNISITDEAYDALSKEKRKDESFTETILRLTRSKGNLADCLGTWAMSDDEEKIIFEKDLPKHWRKSTERLKEIANEMP